MRNGHCHSYPRPHRRLSGLELLLRGIEVWALGRRTGLGQAVMNDLRRPETVALLPPGKGPGYTKAACYGLVLNTHFTELSCWGQMLQDDDDLAAFGLVLRSVVNDAPGGRGPWGGGGDSCGAFVGGLPQHNTVTCQTATQR